MEYAQLFLFAVAFVVGCLYAAVIWVWRQYEPVGLTAFWVVIGDGLVAVFVALLYGLEVAAGVVALLALMGGPQIVGYHVWRVRSQEEDVGL